MKNMTLSLSNKTLCTILTALKNEMSRAREEGNDDVVTFLQEAMDEIMNQPWR